MIDKLVYILDGWENIEIPIHIDYWDVDFFLNLSPPYFINDKRFIDNIHDPQTALLTWTYLKSIKVNFTFMTFRLGCNFNSYKVVC